MWRFLIYLYLRYLAIYHFSLTNFFVETLDKYIPFFCVIIIFITMVIIITHLCARDETCHVGFVGYWDQTLRDLADRLSVVIIKALPNMWFLSQIPLQIPSGSLASCFRGL